MPFLPRYASHPFLLLSGTIKGFFFGHVFMTHFYSFEWTRGPSMLPTLEVVGDNVLISRHYRRGRDVKVGDVVSFHSVMDSGEKVIKRVGGLEGDFVVLQDGEGEGDKMLQVSFFFFGFEMGLIEGIGARRSLLGCGG
jgi:mitochondrial inner membrane protease subunit 1